MNRTYRFHPGAYELGENEKFYSDMEAKGWRLVKRGGYLSRFRRVEPSRARYRIEVYTPPFLEQSVLTDAQIAVYEDCGWEYVADHGVLHIFRAPEGSDAPEFYNDPAQQAATLKKVRRDLWWNLGMAVLIAAAVLLFLNFGEKSFWADIVKHAVMCPTIYTFYLFWIAWGLFQGIWGGWKINRTYRRLKKGLPMDHAPKGSPVLRKIFGQGLLLLAFLSLLVTVGQLFISKSYDLPPEPDGPYIMLSDAGYDGTPGTLFYADPSVTRTRSLLADYWETLEVINDPENGNKQVWMRQEVYRLRIPALADTLAWALMEDATMVDSAAAFRPLEVPGLDAAWATGGMELVAVKGSNVAYVTFLASAYGDFAPLPICEALAKQWSAVIVEPVEKR